MFYSSSISFAQKFEASINVFGGFSISIPSWNLLNKNDLHPTYRTLKPGTAFEISAVGQFGYNYKLPEKTPALESISALLEVGYSRHAISVAYPVHIREGLEEDIVYFNSAVLGIMPKLYFKKPVALGIAVGVKFLANFSVSENNDGRFTGLYGGKYSYADLAKVFKTPVSPYVRIVLESYYNFNKHVAIQYGYISVMSL